MAKPNFQYQKRQKELEKKKKKEEKLQKKLALKEAAQAEPIEGQPPQPDELKTPGDS